MAMRIFKELAKNYYRRRFFPKELASYKNKFHFDSNGEVILIWSFRCVTITLFEVLIGINLAKRGYNVYWVFCNGLCDICDNMTVLDNAKSVCGSCNCYLKGLLDLLPKDKVILLGDHISASADNNFSGHDRFLSFDQMLGFEWEGIKLGEIAHSTALRYTLKGKLEGQSDIDLFRREIVNSLKIASAASKILDELKPKYLFTSHGIYNSWGIITELAKMKDLNITVWAFGYPKNSYLFAKGDSYHRVFPKIPQSTIEKVQIDSQQEKYLMQYLHSREKGSQDYISYFWESDINKDSIKKKLRLKDKFTIGIFTNLSWDAQAVFAEGGPFKTMQEWIIFTVGELIKCPEYQIIIRVHPAEVKGARPSQEKILDIIYRVFGELPPHIKIVPPESDLNSYSLAEFIDVGIVYTTKFGFEMAIRNIPVIVCGGAHYRGKGFTYDVENVEEYLKTLKTINNLDRLNENQVKLAKKYAYFYFFKTHFYCDVIDQNKIHARIPMSILTADPLGDENLCKMCDFIMS
jgi:hypothetical protein